VFRLALINPNTDARHTEAMGDVAREVLPQPAEVTAVSPERGPASIESAADSVVAAAEVAALVRELPAHDAYLVACFGDPGVGAARELTEAPVVGIGEAAYQAAATIARRFAVITTLRRSIPELEDSLERYGMRARCVAVEPLDIPVADQGSHNPGTTAAIVEAGRRVVAQNGAEALVLACGGMADVARAVREQVGVPVCDGVAYGALTAYSLWRCGLTTSKAGAYARPEPIAYAGMPGFGR
jgi:allantoin racemase